MVAAGAGERFGGPKALADFRGRPLLAVTCEALDLGIWETAVVVARDEELPAVRESLAGACVSVVPGGATRSESVRIGVAEGRAPIVAIHDAARPLVDGGAVRELVAAVRAGAKGATLARPCAHALCEVVDGVVGRPAQAGLWEVHTPQAFCRVTLEGLLGPEVPEESRLLRDAGLAVRVVEDPSPNPKITWRGDLAAWA